MSLARLAILLLTPTALVPYDAVMLQPRSGSQEHGQRQGVVPSLLLFVFFLMVFLSVSSGIIASSDGVTIFNVTQAMVERGEISVSGENVAVGVGGKDYSRYGIALSVVAIPFYLLGKLIVTFVPAHLSLLVLKGSVSLVNAVISALACVLFALTARRLGFSSRVSLQLTCAFAFSTFFIVYATKSFLAQPLETLCLLGTVYHLIAYSRDADPRRLMYAGGFCGGGILTKWVFIINLPIFAGYLLSSTQKDRWERGLILFSAPVVAFLGLAFGYNYARFGSILETGYRGLYAFSTPLFVGLYGLLLSSGKSLFLYAPITLFGLISSNLLAKRRAREAWLLLGLFAVNLLVIAQYRDWAGEGSWGPRYLTLVLPCLILPSGSLLESGSAAVRRIFLALTLAGLLVQFGGISVYYGTYYRIIGEFPYRTTPSDPLFLYKAHFVPNYSPAWGQLTMASHNWRTFLNGKKPSLQVDAGVTRIPLSEADREKLIDTLDLWFAYAYYAGLPFSLCLLGMAGSLGATTVIGWQLYQAAKSMACETSISPFPDRASA